MFTCFDSNTVFSCYIQNVIHFFRDETSAFFWLIKDLSDKDPTSIFNLFALWFLNPLVLNYWYLANINGCLDVDSTKLNPAPADPVQAKIFAFPLFLTIILASFPSGLVVYWTINNILTIAQQWVIMKQTKVKTN